MSASLALRSPRALVRMPRKSPADGTLRPVEKPLSPENPHVLTDVESSPPRAIVGKEGIMSPLRKTKRARAMTAHQSEMCLVMPEHETRSPSRPECFKH